MARLLLVEDDESLARVFLRILERGSHEVKAATDYETASGLLGEDHVFDLAILDFWIGEESSLGFLRELRKRFPGIPVLYVSGGGGGLSLEATAALAETGGAAEFLVKPLRPNEILSAVDRLL